MCCCPLDILWVSGSSSTVGKGFVSDEEHFLEAATGVLRSIMDKLVSLREPQVSTSFTFLGYCLKESFLKNAGTCRPNGVLD